jgi:cytochrome c peroxidase
LFTDYGYDTVAVPRNRRLAGNRDPRSFDLGVCERHDPKLHTEDEWYCGSFRTPSLRNVALRSSFMHNGVFSSLRDVVSFYATRGSDPKRWYPGGTFDDLPAKYQKYVNTNAAPYNGAPGDPPALSDQEIDEVIAFLGTLTDKAYPQAP